MNNYIFFLQKWFLVNIFNIFINDEDGGGVAIEELDVENFDFPDAHFQSPYSNFQNEWRHEFYIFNMQQSSWILKHWHVICWVTI